MNKLKLQLYKTFPFLLDKELKDLIKEHNEQKNNYPAPLTKIEEKLINNMSTDLLEILYKNGCSFSSFSSDSTLLHNEEYIDFILKKDISEIRNIEEEMIKDEHIKVYEKAIEKEEYYFYARFPIPSKFINSKKIMDKYFEHIEKAYDNDIVKFVFQELLDSVYQNNELLKRAIQLGKDKEYFKGFSYSLKPEIYENDEFLVAYLEGEPSNICHIPPHLIDKGIDIINDDEKIIEAFNYNSRLFINSKKTLKIMLRNKLYTNVCAFNKDIFEEEDFILILQNKQEILNNGLNFDYCLPRKIESDPRILNIFLKNNLVEGLYKFNQESCTEENINLLKEKLSSNQYDKYLKIGTSNFLTLVSNDESILKIILDKIKDILEKKDTLEQNEAHDMKYSLIRSIDHFKEEAFSIENLKFLKEMSEQSSAIRLNLNFNLRGNPKMLKKILDCKWDSMIPSFYPDAFDDDALERTYKLLLFDDFKKLNVVHKDYNRTMSAIKFHSKEELEHYAKWELKICFITNAMIIVKKYQDSDWKSEELDQIQQLLLNKVKQTLLLRSLDPVEIDNLINKILNGTRNPFTLEYVKTEKSLHIAANYDDILDGETFERISNISDEVLKRINKKHLNEIIRLLHEHNVSNQLVIFLAINMYVSIGLSRSKDLLNKNMDKNYGPITPENLYTLFLDISSTDVLFKEEGNGYVPEYNEQWIKLIFGENYKIKNTPIRNFLNDGKDKGEEIEILKEKIEKDLTLTDTEKREKIQEIDKQAEKYTMELAEFFGLIGRSFREWDIIEEEFFKSEKKTKLKQKLNLKKINEILKLIDSKRKMPDLEPRDKPLLETDVFEYVGYDTQFTVNSEYAPARAVELSRKMEHITKKKFPNISLENNGYTLNVFSPQDRRIISAGYRSRCCFRPNGNADNSGGNNSLMTYCVETEYGGGIEVVDKDGKTIMFSPILRSGNTLMIHSLETNKEGKKLPLEVHQLLKNFSKKVIEESEKNNDDISFVTTTDLHGNLDYQFIVGVLPNDKEFKIYNIDNKFDDMYHNLGQVSHRVLSVKEGKTFNDIYYGPVEYSYHYPPRKRNGYHYLGMNPEEKQIIKKLNDLKNLIINLSNRRSVAKMTGDESISYELLAQIKNAKKEYLSQYKLLLSKTNGKDLFEEYRQATSLVQYVNTELGIELSDDINEITYGEDWYIIIDEQNNIISNFLESGREELKKHLAELKKLRLGSNELEELETYKSDTSIRM